jgi:hypothetical protein
MWQTVTTISSSRRSTMLLSTPKRIRNGHALRTPGVTNVWLAPTLYRASVPSVRVIRHTAVVHEEKDFAIELGKSTPTSYGGVVTS